MSSSIFGSSNFSDKEILQQLKSLEYQVLLSEHGDMVPKGPCIVLLAQCMWELHNRHEAWQAVKNWYRNENIPLFQSETLFFNALLTIAESYLLRSNRGAPSWAAAATTANADNQPVPSVCVGGGYVPKRFLAKGSAGLVYSASTVQSDKQNFVLKRIYPTQFDSALHEFAIAQRLRGIPRAMEYLDLILDDGQAWLLLPLIESGDGGKVDLRSYLGSFSPPQARRVAVQLLEGFKQISERGIVMRDVKPDNVLVDREGNVFWTDFGLALDVKNIRRHEEDLVSYWYDMNKLVPRPKWMARRPPERCFQFDTHTYSFDSYMVGIVLTCVATGIDLPHMDVVDVKRQLELLLDEQLDSSYLTSLELGHLLTGKARYNFALKFQSTFGVKFGSVLFEIVVRMMDMNPHNRPDPGQSLRLLLQACANTG